MKKLLTSLRAFMHKVKSLMKEGQKRKERLTSKLLHQKTTISVDSIFFPFFSPTI